MRGGKRDGAGRPHGQGPYGEQTKPLRIPISMVEYVKGIITNKNLLIPLYGSKVQAGIPAPADDYIEDKIDLNSFLVKHPGSTFLVKASGDSMINANIQDGDILVVDRNIEAKDGKIVIAAIEGYLTVKRLKIKDNKLLLIPENDDYAPIEVNEETGIHIWGVVTSVIHSF